MSRRPLRDRPGLQAERTELAWERSAIGLVAAAALLLLRHVEPMTVARTVVVVLYLVLALATVWLARRRGRRIRVLRTDARGRRTVPDARREVFAVGGGLAIVAAATVVLIVAQSPLGG
ncbi:MAG TPA: DUF202 domain-containing protein [Pseudonocardia sp.]|nr:DUF202 domain-containing protein [Pseudonocardia sp.]